MSYDVARVRGLVPALGDGWVHLDSWAGMQPPERVISAVSTELRTPRSWPGSPFAGSRRAAALDREARAAVAALVGGDPAGVVLGPGRSALLARLADSLADDWLLGDGVVLSRLDAPAVVNPWLRAARRRGASVRWAEIDIETCDVPPWQFDDLVDDSTRVVMVTAASAQVGTCVDVAGVAARTRPAGALLVVDLSAAAAFGPIDLHALGADVAVLDAAAWGGPPMGALVFRTPGLLDRLPTWSDDDARGPARLEPDPHSPPELAGLIASIGHLAGLDEAASGSLRERLHISMSALQTYHDVLLGELVDDLRGVGATVLGEPDLRVPLLSFTVDVPAPVVVDHLAAHGICAYADPGDDGVLGHLGTAEIGGVVRVGLAHYTNIAETRALVRVLNSLHR